MHRQTLSRSATQTALLLVVLVLSLSAAAVVRAAMPFNSATVTRVENQVKFGQVKAGRSETRLANPQDIVKASDFLLSEKDSRAELKYPDGSIVRIGQNTVFSFDANTRTLTLEKGTFVAYVPKGSGGATVKTPSLTAALTGTTIKVSATRIAVVDGSIRVEDGTPGGMTVNAGEYVEFNPDGNPQLTKHSFSNTTEGLLMTFNGQLPTDTPLENAGLANYGVSTIPGITFEDAQNAPSVVQNRNRIIIKPPPPEENSGSGGY